MVVAQVVEVVSRGDVQLKAIAKDKASMFIHPKTDTTQFQYVATYTSKVTDTFFGMVDLFFSIKERARKDGANCFKINSIVYDSLKRPALTMDTYFGPGAAVAANSANYEKNAVYIFGSGRSNNDSFSLKINNETQTFHLATYLKYVLKEGEELKIGKGGFTGARARLRYEQNKAPLYLMVFGGARLGGGPLPAPASVGLSLNTGQIKEMTDDYGQFLVQVFKQAN